MARTTMKALKAMKAKGGGAKGGKGGTKVKGGGAKDKGGIEVKGGTKARGGSAKGKGKGKRQGQGQKGKGKSKGQGNFPRKKTQEDKDEQGGAIVVYVRTLGGEQKIMWCGKHDIVRKLKERMPINWADKHPNDILLMKPVPYWDHCGAQISSGDIVYAVNQAKIEDKPVCVNGRLYLNQTLFEGKKEKATNVKDAKEKQVEEQEIPRTPCVREECVATRKRLHECLWGGGHYPALSRNDFRDEALSD